MGKWCDKIQRAIGYVFRREVDMLKLLSKIVYLIVLLLKLLVIIRFFLKFIGANEENFFVHWIYDKSDLVLIPFRGIVEENITIWNLEIEFISLIAIIFFIIISYILKEMIKTFSE